MNRKNQQSKKPGGVTATGKNASTRNHPALPYVVAASNSKLPPKYEGVFYELPSCSDNYYVVCKLCPHSMDPISAWKSTTSSLRTHLNDFHPGEKEKLPNIRSPRSRSPLAPPTQQVEQPREQQQATESEEKLKEITKEQDSLS